MKHNKKRNTAFLYEILVRELTYSIVSRNKGKQGRIVEILKTYFSSNTVLGQELALCKALQETTGIEKDTAEKILSEIKRVYFGLSQPEIFTQQTELIDTINKDLGKRTFSNFVPNFKSLATISQIFDDKAPVKSRVLMEEKIVKRMIAPEESAEELKPIDNLVYKKFTEKFNQEYTGKLSENQKELLNRYIISFSDNGLSLKMFLNEEISRLTSNLTESLQVPEIKEDLNMTRKTNSVIEMLGGLKERNIDKEMVTQVLKVQELVAEINS
jgi:hypothetical protein